MNKFENVYQDAALMRKVLLGEANEVEQQDLEKRLAECPDLQKVYGQLRISYFTNRQLKYPLLLPNIYILIIVCQR